MIEKFLILDRKKQKLILLLFGILIIALGTILGSGLKNRFLSADGANEEIIFDEKIEIIEEEMPLKEIQVYVSGAVNSPGVYTLSEGDRVVKVIEMAGIREDGDIESLNLAQILTDECKVTVPVKGEGGGESPGEMGNTENVSGGISSNGKVNVNKASASELETVNGIGPQMAKKIITYREANGNFTNLEDMLNISGIGEKTLEKISTELTI